LAGTDGGAIFATDDGGLTWHNVHQAETNAAWLDLAFADSSEVVAVGARLEPDYTTTGLIDKAAGGTSAWTRELASAGSHLLGVSFASPGTGFAVGVWGEIFARMLESNVPNAPGASSPRLSLRVLGNPGFTETVFEIRSAAVVLTGAGATPSAATVEIFDVNGASVQTLTSRWKGADGVNLAWDGRSTAGGRVPAGAYFARARAGDLEATARFFRLR
jgi:hypothetical protein